MQGEKQFIRTESSEAFFEGTESMGKFKPKDTFRSNGDVGVTQLRGGS